MSLQSASHGILLPLLCTLPLVPVQTSAQIRIGNLTSYAVAGKALTLWADSVRVRLVFYAPDIVRVDFLPSPATQLDSSFVIIRDTSETVAMEVRDQDSILQVSTSSMVIRCVKSPMRLGYYSASMNLLLSEGATGGFATSGPARQIGFRLGSDDHFYGTGERGTDLDKRGQAFGSYNDTFFGYTSPLPRMNLNIPFLASTAGYALYFEDSYGGNFDLGAMDPSMFSLPLRVGSCHSS